MAGETAWDTAYWCSAHQIAHTARQLIEEHNTAPSGAGERDVLAEANSEAFKHFGVHPWWPPTGDFTGFVLAALAARGYTLSRSEPEPLPDEQWNEAYRAGRAAGITEVIDSRAAPSPEPLPREEAEPAYDHMDVAGRLYLASEPPREALDVAVLGKAMDDALPTILGDAPSKYAHLVAGYYSKPRPGSAGTQGSARDGG